MLRRGRKGVGKIRKRKKKEMRRKEKQMSKE